MEMKEISAILYRTKASLKEAERVVARMGVPDPRITANRPPTPTQIRTELSARGTMNLCLRQELRKSAIGVSTVHILREPRAPKHSGPVMYGLGFVVFLPFKEKQVGCRQAT